MAEQRQNNVALTDEEKEQRAKKRNRTIITVVSVAAAVLIVVIVLLLLLVKCEPEENVDPPVEHTHTYSSWVVVDEPTCTEEGLRERTCSCGEKETEMIAALGHTAGEAVRENEKAPTCTAKGSYEEVVSCTVCEEEVSRKTVEVAALGHTEGEAEKENEVAATCTAAGSYEEVVCCAVCGEEVSRKTVEVAALGHDYKGVVTDEALCLVPGEMTYTCTRCDDSYTEEIAPLRHSWSETKPGLAPTCTSAGYTSYETCTRCGYSNRETIPAAGHTWGEWVETTAATCTTAGEQKHTCSACGVEEKEEIAVDPTAHKPDKTDYIADEKGHWFACSVCGGKASVAEHDYTGNVQNCTICGVTDSKYFNFTLLDDDSSYGIGQMVTLLDEPDDTNLENPFGSLPAFTDAVKLPDYYKDLPITELTGMTVEKTIENPGGDPLTMLLPFDSFNLNTTLKSIELSNFITGISENAFAGCSELTSVNIPDSVTSIGDNAFDSCTSLAEIEIPDSVTSIGDYAFRSCTSLAEIEIPDRVSLIGEGIFRGCAALVSVTLPKGIETIEYNMFNGCTSLTTIENLDSVTTIGEQAFAGCASLTSITIPEGVTTIEYSVFNGCTALETVVLHDNITSIGSVAFMNSGVKNITLPANLEKIGTRAFEGCTKLETITIPEKVTVIGKHAFYLCSSLKKAYFKDETSVWSIPKFDTDPSRLFTPKNDDPGYNAMYLTAEFDNPRDWEKKPTNAHTS